MSPYGRDRCNAHPPPPEGFTMVGSMGEGGGHMPKACGVKCRGWEPQPCNTEGARGG